MAKFCVSPAQTQSLASGAQVIDGSVGIGSFGKLQKTPSASVIGQLGHWVVG